MAPAPAPNQTLAQIHDGVDKTDEQENGAITVKNTLNLKSNNGKKNEIDIYSNVYPPPDIVWKNVFLFTLLHIGAILGLSAIVTGQVMWKTVAFAVFCHFVGALGITAGVHRLWSHKAYKAKLPLRIFLAFANTVAFQNSVYEWSRDHRVHHKYSETLADPHNAKRGFFFAHIGWLLCRKHEAITMKGKQIDLSDLEADPVVMFQHRHYKPLVVLTTFVLPTVIPWYFWGETLYNAYVVGLFRYICILHFTWCVNSVAHYWGSRPYEKEMYPRQNKFVSVIAIGEGWHNYHHTFPWDYKAAELGAYNYNYTTAFLDFMAAIGQAYDLKTVPGNVIKQRIARTGDGSHHFSHGVQGHEKPGPYAWGDEDIPEADIAVTETLYKLKEN